jgi:hypothetical protein
VLLLASLLSIQPLSTTADGSNVTTSQSTTIADNGGTLYANFTSTGVGVSILDVAGGYGNIVVTTEVLNAPSAGVLNVSSSSSVLYYDVNVTLAADALDASDSVASVSVSNPSITSTYTLEYWSGGAWSNAIDVSVIGTTITGTIPLTALSGTNVAVVNTQHASTSSASTTPILTSTTATITSMSSNDEAVLGVVLVVLAIVIVAGFVLMRGRAKPKPAPAAPAG